MGEQIAKYRDIQGSSVSNFDQRRLIWCQKSFVVREELNNSGGVINRRLDWDPSNL